MDRGMDRGMDRVIDRPRDAVTLPETVVPETNPPMRPTTGETASPASGNCRSLAAKIRSSASCVSRARWERPTRSSSRINTSNSSPASRGKPFVPRLSCRSAMAVVTFNSPKRGPTHLQNGRGARRLPPTNAFSTQLPAEILQIPQPARLAREPLRRPHSEPSPRRGDDPDAPPPTSAPSTPRSSSIALSFFSAR